MSSERIHFVTGRLAEASLRRVLADLAPRVGFEYTVDVLKITVAALMTPEWIAARIAVPPGTHRIMISGYCEGDLKPLREATQLPVERGPRDLRRLPDFFGTTPLADDYGEWDIEIIAEINHCPRRQVSDIVGAAAELTKDGADLIDVGCVPGSTWSGVGAVVRALRDAGHRVSIDSMDPREVEAAVHAGAELVLSVNSANRQLAAGWGVEVVAIADEPRTMAGLDDTLQFLTEAGVSVRADPILEPIGFGFADSLGRFIDFRRRHPTRAMMMGIGNLTELTDADSAGLNVLLLGFCAELGIRSVLTTQVINWAQTSVRECALARQLVHYAVQHATLPKHLEPRLVILRDADPVPPDPTALNDLAAAIKDHHIRIFAEAGQIHVVTSGIHLAGTDPFVLFERLEALRNAAQTGSAIDPRHAFYLGYEICKATTALALGKGYQQDRPLDWGLLTEAEGEFRNPKSEIRMNVEGRNPNE
jgi:dihydropteroate synthase-like protein